MKQLSTLCDDLGLETQSYDSGLLIEGDCCSLLGCMEQGSLHAIVTDPPYGIKEYDVDQLAKRSSGQGGIWRIPPNFDGSRRMPLPRFTALTLADRMRIDEYFYYWGRLALRVMRPGGHLIIACNSFLSQVVYTALVRAGFEYRGEFVRLVMTLRGGDRPKNSEKEYSDVCTLPRSAFEPWGSFRKPIPNGMKVSDCLARYGTGGLRRSVNGSQLRDVIPSERTPKAERAIADHPSLKPQSFMRTIVRAALPLGTGVVLDPFMGAGSTVAAGIAVGYSVAGIERLSDYYGTAKTAVPKLARLPVRLFE